MPAPSTGEARRATMGQRSRALQFPRHSAKICNQNLRLRPRLASISGHAGLPLRPFLRTSEQRPPGSLPGHELVMQAKPLFCFDFDATVVFRASLAFCGNGIEKQQKGAASYTSRPEGE